MRILVLSQYFWPESFIINDIVRTLIDQGHEVTVATGKPNYPDGKIFSGYCAWGTQHERYLNQADVLRVPIWPRGKGGAKNLLLNYLSFVFSGLLFLPWMLRKHKFDAILVFAPSPILQVIPAILLKWLKKAKLALWVQDLWPESLSATGFISSRFLLKGLGWLVKGIYCCCDKLLVQSKAFIKPVSRHSPVEKIYYYPNSMVGSPADVVVPMPYELTEVLDKYFCVVFAGNLGTAQALDTLVKVATELQDDSQIRLVLVGSGSRLQWLHSQKQDLGLNNLILPGRFPMEAMPQIFARASALLASLTAQEIFSHTIPSKIQAYLAAGRPIIASINGEGARVVLEAGAGLVSPAEDVASLVQNIRSLKALGSAERVAMGRAARVYFEANFEMSTQVQRLVELLGEK